MSVTETSIFPQAIPLVKREEIRIDENNYIIYNNSWFTGGVCTYFEHTNSLRELVTYLAGDRHGPSCEWHKPDQFKSQRYYFSGSLHGPSCAWYENGQLKSKEVWENGILMHGKYWDKSGVLYDWVVRETFPGDLPVSARTRAPKDIIIDFDILSKSFVSRIAREEFEQIPEDDVEQNLLYHGINAFWAKNYNEALDIFNKAFDYGKTVALLYNRALVKETLNDITGAYEDYSAAIEINERLATLYIYRAYVLYKYMKEYGAALDDLTRSIELDPQNYHAYDHRASVLSLLERREEAIRDLSRALENVVTKELLNRRGVQKYSINDLPGALDDYNKALAIDDAYEIAYYNRGIVMADLHKHQEAIDDYTKAIEYGNYLNAYFNRAHRYFEVEEYSLSAEDYSSVIELDPENHEGYLFRGKTKAKMNDHEGAIEDFTKAITFHPTYAESYFDRGISFEKTGDLEKALLDFEKAESLDPELLNATYRKGDVMYHLGDYEGSIAAFNTFIATDPLHAGALYSRSWSQFAKGDLQQALEDVMKVIEIRNDNDEYHVHLGYILIKLNRFKEAVEAFKMAVQFNLTNSNNYLSLSISCLLAGQQTKAIEIAEKGLAVHRNSHSDEQVVELLLLALLNRQDPAFSLLENLNDDELQQLEHELLIISASSLYPDTIEALLKRINSSF